MSKYEAFKKIVEIKFSHELMCDIQARFVLEFLRDNFKAMQSLKLALQDILIPKIVVDEVNINKAVEMYTYMSVILF